MTEPTVYGYVDLASSQVGHPENALVPLSVDDDILCWAWSDIRRAERVGEREWSAILIVGGPVTLVRGARALEVAEREVREAVDELYPLRYDRASDAEKCDGGCRLTFTDGSAWSVGVQDARLSRAVDLRDRLCAKLGSLLWEEEREKHRPPGTATLTKSDARDKNVGHYTSNAWSTVHGAAEHGVCRVCGLKPEHGPGMPFVYNHVKEHAHEACLAQECMHAKGGASITVSLPVNGTPEFHEALASLYEHDPLALSEYIGREHEACLKCDDCGTCGHARLGHDHDWKCGALECRCLAWTPKSAGAKLPETQPVFLATLRPAESRDYPNGATQDWRPWTIMGQSPWRWFLSDAQADELKRTGNTHDTDKHGKRIEFVAQDWKPLDVHVNFSPVNIAPIADVKKVAQDIGREVAEALNLKKEAKPMPEKPKPDPHAECRLSLRDGVLVDDYGRTLGVGASVEASTNCGRLWLTVTVPHSDVPPSDARPASTPPAPPEPIVLKLDREIPSAELEHIVDEFRLAQRSCIILPSYIHRVTNPEENEVRADIAHRADIHAASKKGWRWGLAVGALSGVILSFLAATLTARFAPHWLWRAVDRVESSRRAPAPSADEHAQESEDARSRAEGR